MSKLKTKLRYLIHDEVETFKTGNGRSYAFRVRAWRGQGVSSAVLVTSVTVGNRRAEVFPAQMVDRIANWCLSALCSFDPHMIFFVERTNRETDEVLLGQAVFESFGYDDRRRLMKGLTKPVDWKYMEFIAGTPVDH